MKIVLKSVLYFVIVFLFSGCATLVSSWDWPLKINSIPSGAKIEIKNLKGNIVYSGNTPSSISLRSGSKMFVPESYSVKISTSKEEKIIPVGCKLNQWYWGNILLGGVIGMLIVDPATGAMFQLDREDIIVQFSDTTAIASNIIRDFQSKDTAGFHVGDFVKIPRGFSTITGKIVEVKTRTVIVEYEKKGKVKRVEVFNSILE